MDFIKNNKNFNEVAKREVKLLNGTETNSSSIESWKAGYNYARRIIQNSIENDFNDEFVDKMQNMTEIELDEFDL
jgi:hypothetical protein